MHRMDRRSVMGSAACALAGMPLYADDAASSKKGFGIALKKEPTWREMLKQLGVHWFYTWGAGDMVDNIPPGIEFVPMQWGKWGCSPEAMQQIKAAGRTTLLGFNEPDQESQANMSVENALELWPLLESTGLRLGSPAGVHPDGEWMTAFMQEAKNRGLRIDFVTIHSYMGSSVAHFFQRLEKIYRLYKKPLWITEFAVADWQAREDRPNRYLTDAVLRFMEEALPKLEATDYVERYAWFSAAPSSPVLGPSALFNEEGSLNRLGQLYASL